MAVTDTSTGNTNMGNWWESKETSVQQPKFAFRAVAYYRHSAQDRQENSISIQQDQVRPWAESNGGEIIHEFIDAGKSGLTAEGRPGFQDMMQNWVKKRNDFQYILCLDVSRWGRFQDSTFPLNTAPSAGNTARRLSTRR
jgi:DNA invertase Pin-like site-specific DNA recombinase